MRRLRLEAAKMVDHIEKTNTHNYTCLTNWCEPSSGLSADPGLEACGKSIKTQCRGCLSEQVSTPLRAYQRKNSLLLEWDVQNVVLSLDSVKEAIDFPTRGDLRDKFKTLLLCHARPICKPDLTELCMSTWAQMKNLVKSQYSLALWILQ